METNKGQNSTEKTDKNRELDTRGRGVKKRQETLEEFWLTFALRELVWKQPAGVAQGHTDEHTESCIHHERGPYIVLHLFYYLWLTSN